MVSLFDASTSYPHLFYYISLTFLFSDHLVIFTAIDEIIFFVTGSGDDDELSCMYLCSYHFDVFISLLFI